MAFKLAKKRVKKAVAPKMPKSAAPESIADEMAEPAMPGVTPAMLSQAVSRRASKMKG